MEEIEDRTISEYPITLNFWKRYVDDIITALPEKSIQSFLGHLNSIESTINFTVEIESENKKAFLDTEITHQGNGSLSTTVYRKKTHTDQYLSFHSHHPISHKIAVVNTLYSRAESICSTEQELEKERIHVKKVLRNNGYPERILAARTRKKEDKKKDKDTPKCTIVIPDTVWNMQKDIHRRTLKHRVKEHRRALISHNANFSTVAEHAMRENHDITWDEASVIDGNDKWIQRCH